MSPALPPTPAPNLLSVEQVAEILKLNVRTVRGYVRRGALKATRIGKQYRITLADLESFTGGSVESHDERRLSAGGSVEISSVITVEGVTPELANRLTTLLVASANAPHSGEPPLSVSTHYDVERDRMRVMLAADLARTRDFLALIDALLESPAGGRSS